MYSRLGTFSMCVSIAMLGGCVQNGPKSYEDAAAQNYGDPIDQADAQSQAHDVMQNLLKDPESARWSCRPPEKGWIGSGMAFGGQTIYGWVLVCGINAKNSYGAYNGAQEYHFVFRSTTLMRAAIFAGGGAFATQQVIYNHP